MWFVATLFTYGRQMSRDRHHKTRPLLRCLPLLPQSNELPTTVPEEVNLPSSSQEDAPLSSPEVVPTAADTI